MGMIVGILLDAEFEELLCSWIKDDVEIFDVVSIEGFESCLDGI